MSATTAEEVLNGFRQLPGNEQDEVAEQIDQMTLARRWEARWIAAGERLKDKPPLTMEEIVEEVKAIRRERRTGAAG